MMEIRVGAWMAGMAPYPPRKVPPSASLVRARMGSGSDRDHSQLWRKAFLSLEFPQLMVALSHFLRI